MNRWTLGSLGLLAMTLLASQDGRAQLSAPIQTLTPGLTAAWHKVTDVNGDQRADLLVVASDGRVLVWPGVQGSTPLQDPPLAFSPLPRPERCIVALADWAGTGTPQLVSAGPEGVRVQALTAGAAAETVSRRAVFTLRTGAPVPCDLVQDVNGDQRLDVVLPVVAHPRSRRDLYELWVQDRSGEQPGLRLAASVPLQVDRDLESASAALSDVLVSSLTVPRLAVRDVNGDGRGDLLIDDGARRAFHLQRADNTLPAEPDVQVDLGIFKDTTPKAMVRPGRTLAAIDAAQLQSRDLDGDGIPDWVVAHRRKVWVFHGSQAGPQFTTPTTILKTADDITLLVVVKLDDDAFADLLLVKVVVPTVATLITGMLGSWDVELLALGYRNTDGKRFDPTPQWKSQLTIQLPSIISVLRNPQAILGRFEAVGRKFRREVTGDLDGDGRGDVLLPTEARDRLEAWRGTQPRPVDDGTPEAMLRGLLFEDPDRQWDIDRILKLLTAQAEARVARLTGGRAADAAVKLRDPAVVDLVDLVTADLDGDGRDEVVAVYEDSTLERKLTVDVIVWR